MENIVLQDIVKIESATPVTITMEDGSTLIAYRFDFISGYEARLDPTEGKEKEVTRRKGKQPATLDLEEIVKREWERGLTDKEIADALNYSSTYISNIRRDLGLERNHTKIHEKRAKEISELYEKGMSDSKISYELDINKYHVQEWRRKNGKPTHYPQKGGRK